MTKVSTVLGIGVDIVKISRFNDIIKKNGIGSDKVVRLSKRILHSNEITKFQEHQNSHNIDQCVRLLSGSWATKEALFKTLDLADQKKFHFKHWYKLTDSFGKPSISNDEYSEHHTDEQFLVSVSHDGEYLIANVLRQKFYEQ